MFESMDELRLFAIYEGISAKQGDAKNRPNHILVFKCFGESAYDFPDRTLVLSEGSLLYIPKGASYTWAQTSPGESRYILLRFDADLSSLPPSLFSLPHPVEMQLFFRSMVRRWLFGDPAQRHLCYAMFYELLAAITAPQNQDYKTSHQKRLLADSIAYLEQHIFDPGLTIAEIVACSGISETYFRRIFLSIYGQSPKQYIQSKRLSQAQAILESGDFTTIQSVAAQVGYDDPLYFSRAFKRKYGVAPSEL